MKDKVKRYLLNSLSTFVLLLPIITYVRQFGFNISDSHQRWAEMGSAMSGIYSPIFAFFALLILAVQAASQNKINKHQYDQTFIQENKTEVNFYIEQLDSYLQKPYDLELTIREYLEENFELLSEDQLKSVQIFTLAESFNKSHGRVFSIWLALYPILIGLNSQKEFPYKHNFGGCILRITSILSIKSCVAIDNFYYCLSGDLQKGKYFFNRYLGTSQGDVGDLVN